MLLIALINILVGTYGFIGSARKNSVCSLYWASFFFFFGIPYFIDSLAITFDLGRDWSLLLYENDENYVYDFSKTNMSLMGLYVLFFNLSFFIGSKISKNPYLAPKQPAKNSFATVILIAGWLALFYFLKTYNYTWFEANFNRKIDGAQQVCTILVMLSSSAAYLNFKLKNNTLAVFALIPTIFLATVLSERPYFVPVIGVIFCAFSSNYSRSFRGLLILATAGLLFALSLTFIRKIGSYDNEPTSIFAIIRDSSTNVLYDIFSMSDYYKAITEGAALKFLLLTGLSPASIFGARSFLGADIPSMLALDKFGWTEGTIHPTIYGWAYVDMGFYALVFAGALGFLLSTIENKLVPYSQNIYSIFIASSSTFIFVAFRGSVQVGYAKSLYIMIIGLIIFFTIRHYEQFKSKREIKLTTPNK